MEICTTIFGLESSHQSAPFGFKKRGENLSPNNERGKRSPSKMMGLEDKPSLWMCFSLFVFFTWNNFSGGAVFQLCNSSQQMDRWFCCCSKFCFLKKITKMNLCKTHKMNLHLDISHFCSTRFLKKKCFHIPSC